NDWGSLGYEEADYDDSRTASYAVEFLEQEHDQPFFLACGLFRPHLPWYVPQHYFDQYPIEKVVLPEVKADDIDDLPEAGKSFAEARRSDLEQIQKADKWREAIQAYLASITYADAQLGRVLNALDASGATDNTVVVLWSDHGWHLGEKNHWHKTTLWEEATRVPFVISAPGFEPALCARAVSLVDLFPTLNELCELEAIESHDGKSLVPLMSDPDASLDRMGVMIQFRPGNVALRTDRFRYIRYADGGEEFYDLERDPNEWNNLVDDSNYREVRIEMEQSVIQEWAESAPTKSAFDFDPDTFTWKEKTTGRVIDGRSVVNP
ncbi:MAG: sulfatase-like hydrolase/transferase, partial [Verrucomicrobiota bacterium]